MYHIRYNMGCEADLWAKEWLEKKRDNGETGLTVEKRGNIHIVRRQRLVTDADTGRRRKESEYLGALSEDGTVRDPRPRRDRIEVEAVTDEGTSRVLAKAAEGLLDPLSEAFPSDHPEIIELAFARCLDRGELNRAGTAWKKMDDVLGLKPNISPKSLSDVLGRIGRSRASQDMFFDLIGGDDRTFAVDLSVIFSRAKGATLCKKGYNRFRLSTTHVNLVMVCGLESGMPQYMNVVPGNMKEGCAETMLEELDIDEGTILVLDRGYCGDPFLRKVRENGLEYVVAAKRNSRAYDIARTEKERIFRWERSVVSYGKAQTGDGQWAYRFENMTQRNDELLDLLIAVENGRKKELNVDKAGNFLILSSLDVEPRTIYRMYKTRCAIEERFDTAKNCLSADRTYMQDDEHITGHLFVSFVSLMIWMRISEWIDSAGMSGRMTVKDVLDTYSVMKKVTVKGVTVTQIVPKDVAESDRMLDLYLFTEKRIPKKRGRKPKDPHID